MIKYIKLIIFVIFCNVCSAQNQAILLRGRVLNDTIDRGQLTVYNKTLGKGTITTDRGDFVIEARLKDTLILSAVQYEVRELVVNKTMIDRKRISLYLVPKINELANVDISNIDLSGDLTKDAISTGATRQASATDFGLPLNTAPKRTIEERRYYTAVTSGGGIPLDGLINAITGRLKLLKGHIKLSRFEKGVEDLRYKFSDSLYVRGFDIPKDLVDDFVYYAFEDNEVVQKSKENNILALFEILKEKAPKYLALKGLAD